MVQHIPLTRGYTALVDDADFPWLSQWRWIVMGEGYAGRFDRANGGRKVVYMHRQLLEAGADQRVDHINGQRADNRRANLRLVTRRQN